MSHQPPPRGLRAVEAWWPLIARILSFLTGMAILLWQNVVENEAQDILVGAGLALLGLPVLPAIRALLTPPPPERDEAP